MNRAALSLSLALGAALLWWGGRAALGFTHVPVGASADAPRLSWLSEVLARHVREGRVDYAGLSARRRPLSRFVAGLGEVGPRSTPARYPDGAARLAYYINAYNALVLHAVVAHYPITSVHEVRGPIEPKPGFGFFYGLHFTLDGARENLYGLEHTHIRGFGDARVHAAINCASASCPALRAQPYRAGTLDAQLEDAMRAFVADPAQVSVRDGGVLLNPIFDWYREDFEADAGDGTLLGYVAAFAPPKLARSLADARAAGVEPTFSRYDWGLNGR